MKGLTILCSHQQEQRLVEGLDVDIFVGQHLRPDDDGAADDRNDGGVGDGEDVPRGEEVLAGAGVRGDSDAGGEDVGGAVVLREDEHPGVDVNEQGGSVSGAAAAPAAPTSELGKNFAPVEGENLPPPSEQGVTKPKKKRLRERWVFKQ